jgi:hypothetical protein
LHLSLLKESPCTIRCICVGSAASATVWAMLRCSWASARHSWWSCFGGFLWHPMQRVLICVRCCRCGPCFCAAGQVHNAAAGIAMQRAPLPNQVLVSAALTSTESFCGCVRCCMRRCRPCCCAAGQGIGPHGGDLALASNAIPLL